MSNIYLLQVGDFFKIGYTKNDVNKRVKQLQTGCPDEISIKAIYKTKHNMKIERTLHRLFSHKRAIGEFFDLECDDILNFLPLCEKYEKALDSLNSLKKYNLK